MVSTALTLENATSENKLSPIPFSTCKSEPQKTNLLNDQISLLFPKCRPKNDININQLSATSIKPTILNSRAGVDKTSKMQPAAISPPTSSLSSESSLTSKSPNVGTNPFLSGPDLATNYSLAGSYFNSQMRDSNIDGVLKYSQKRSKNNSYYYNNPQPQQQQQPQFNQQRENGLNIWELRNRTSVNTVLNSPDLIEMETKLTYTKQPYNHIRVGRSPVSHPELIEEQTNLTTVYDDGIVVFDDIEEDWNSSRMQFSDGAESKLYEENRENEKKYLSLLKKNQNEDNSIEVSKLNVLPNKNISGIMGKLTILVYFYAYLPLEVKSQAD